MSDVFIFDSEPASFSGFAVRCRQHCVFGGALNREITNRDELVADLHPFDREVIDASRSRIANDPPIK